MYGRVAASRMEYPYPSFQGAMFQGAAAMTIENALMDIMVT